MRQQPWQDCATLPNSGTELGAPYEVARARTALGEAFRSEGDEEAARLELDSAKRLSNASALCRTQARSEPARRDQGTAARAGDRLRRTFVFTDIVGSTPLVEALGDEAWQELIRWHDQTFRAIFDRYGGMEVRQTGDGFFVAFDDPTAAIEAAVAVQRSLAEQAPGPRFRPASPNRVT